MINLIFWAVYAYIIQDYITCIVQSRIAVVDMVAFVVIVIQENRAKRGVVMGRKHK